MNEKEANIDLLFRNGLKDYEVLPPFGVCDNILSAVRIKSRPYVFLRIAAAITVLTALSFLTYRWSRQVLVEPSSAVIAFNVPVSSRLYFFPHEIHKICRREKKVMLKVLLVVYLKLIT